MNTVQVKSLLLFLFSFYAFLFIPLMPLWAQGTSFSDDDIAAPTIQHDPDTRSIRVGDSLTIRASVRDNIGVEKVTLFYRKTGETNYSSIQMKSTGGAAYSATVPAKEVTGPKMEYYIQASDKARNRSVRGVKNFPLTLTVLAPLPPKKEAFSFRTDGDADTPTLEKPWYKKWWVWTIAAVVVGGVAAGSGGGGGSSSGNSTTGTATISGPIP